MKFLLTLILFMLGYKIIKKLFSPALDNAGGNQQKQQTFHRTYTNTRPSSGKSNVVEDIDYEEVD